MSQALVGKRVCLVCRVTVLSRYNSDPLCAVRAGASRDLAGIVPTWLWDSPTIHHGLLILPELGITLTSSRVLQRLDEFATQVITTAKDNILILIRRLDSATGWGQNLRIDILIVDSVINP